MATRDTRRRLTAAANALDLLVEGRIFLAQRIVRIAEIFFAGHVAGARLTVTDRRLDRRLSRIFRDRRALRECVRASDQNHQRRRQDCFSHCGSPIFDSVYRVGISITPQLRRPWAAQSCTFRTSAMVPSNQTPAATSTTKKPSITAFSTLRLLSSSGGSLCVSSPSVIAGVTASADRDERHRNNQRYDNAF